MKEKDIKLFDKAIHNIKKIMMDIENERKYYHTKLEQLKDGHDKEMQTLLKEGKEILEEVYELFEDLYKEKKGDNTYE